MTKTLIGLFLFSTAASFASFTVVTETGNSGASNPLGYYAPYGSQNNPGVGAVSWTQTVTFLDVTISANVWEVNQGSPAGIVNYTLVKAIGSGTTYAADGVSEGSITPSFGPTDTDLVTLPSLGPGTYYLVVDSPTANTSWSYGYSGAPSGTVTTDPSVTFNGDYSARGSSVDGAYTPASSFFGVTGFLPLEFSVTSDLVAPEPATGGFVLAGVAGLLILRRRPARSR